MSNLPAGVTPDDIDALCEDRAPGCFVCGRSPEPHEPDMFWRLVPEEAWVCADCIEAHDLEYDPHANDPPLK